MNYDGTSEAIKVHVNIAGVDPTSIKTVVVIQTVSYGIKQVVDADIKMPIINIFQTPYGFSKLKADGVL